MLALDLNLASRPFKNNTLLWTGYVSGLVLLVAFSAWNVLSWREHVHRLDELQRTVGSIEGQMESLDLREAVAREGIAGFDQKALGIQAFKANEVIEWRVFSWTRLFNLMEQIQPNNVRMTSIRPLFRAGRRAEELGTEGVTPEKTVPVSVAGLARDFDALMNLEKALFADGHITRVLPERWHLADSGEIIFDLTFIYSPDSETAPPAEDEESEALAAEKDEEPAPPTDEPAADPAPAPPDAAEAVAPAPAGPAVPVAVRPAAEGEEGETRPEEAVVEKKLAEGAEPGTAPQRPFVKGRDRSKAKRREGP